MDQMIADRGVRSTDSASGENELQRVEEGSKHELLPMRPGELGTAYLMSRWMGAKFVAVIPSMAVERSFDALWLAGSLLLLVFQALAFSLGMLGCGLPGSFWIGVAVFLIMRLGTAVPNAPANVGSCQFFTVAGLTLFGVDEAAATGFHLWFSCC